jgi:hypothetical protein
MSHLKNHFQRKLQQAIYSGQEDRNITSTPNSPNQIKYRDI